MVPTSHLAHGLFEPDNETVKLGQCDHVSVECIHEFYTGYGNNKQLIDCTTIQS